MKVADSQDLRYMRLALRLAARGFGCTSPNPMVGAVLVKAGRIIGQGWHRRAGEPHAEIEALRNASLRGHKVKGATLYVTLEPCCTFGRTPPCTAAIIDAKIKRVVVGAEDPNPAHAGRGLKILRDSGIAVDSGVSSREATRLNESFNHWIVHKTPFVTVKAAMSLDGKIATVSGESKWITGEKSRAYGMKLRQAADAILVGVNTIIKDNPALTFRPSNKRAIKANPLRRIVLDPTGRIPLTAAVLSDERTSATTVVVTKNAPKDKIDALQQCVRVLTAPAQDGKIDLHWLLRELGHENVTHLLVEGGGETNAHFVLSRLAHRIAFFYAPIIIGGRNAPKGVAGDGIQNLREKIELADVEWLRLGPDLLLQARVI